ncbi:MAG: flagellar biosynthesis anti-sigma factor FlgM [Chromatiales bacterium]|jgi:negative regulator of flagellin synthesis FlgM
MKINDVSHSQPQKPGEGQTAGEAQGKAGAPNRAGSPATASDTVTITQTAQQLNEMHDALATVPVVDTQKVQQIRAAIESGSYEVRPERIAEKLLSIEEQL